MSAFNRAFDESRAATITGRLLAAREATGMTIAPATLSNKLG